MRITKKLAITASAAVVVVAGAGVFTYVHLTDSATAAPAPVAAAPAAGVSVEELAVPPQLVPPAGQQLVGTYPVAEGSQVYQCAADKWTLLEPAAVLSSGNDLVLHTRGPQWISAADGSAVTGTVVATVPVTGAVPELLLKASANRGSGKFGAVDFVQRLRTQGGVAPTTECTDGALQAVRYSATYRFFVAAH